MCLINLCQARILPTQINHLQTTNEENQGD